jgi:hypothetical protein
MRGAGIYGGNAGAAGWREVIAKWDQAAAAAAEAADQASTEQERANDGPSIQRTGVLGQPPEEVRAETPEQTVARKRADTELADALGLDAPIKLGADVGQCPGSGGYGHGLTAVTVHSGRCCARWDEARAAAIAAGAYEPTALDKLMVTDPAAARLEIARNRSTRPRTAKWAWPASAGAEAQPDAGR